MKPSFALSMLLGLAALTVVALMPVSVPGGDDIRIGDTGRPSPTIAKGVVVSQEFPATSGNLASLSVLLGTYKRVNQGQIILTLAAQRDGNWQVLATETLAKETLRDNRFETVAFNPPLSVRASEMLQLTLQSPDRPESGVMWWTSPDISRQGFSLLVNGQEQKGTASFAATYTHPTGRLIQMVGPIWGRMTLFLDPGWRLDLLLGLASLAATILLLSARLLAGVRWVAPPPVGAASPAETLHDGDGGERHDPDHPPIGPRE